MSGVRKGLLIGAIALVGIGVGTYLFSQPGNGTVRVEDVSTNGTVAGFRGDEAFDAGVERTLGGEPVEDALREVVRRVLEDD